MSCIVREQQTEDEILTEYRTHNAFHPLQLDAWKKIVLDRRSMFITGGGGCGKSYLIRKIVEFFRQHGREVVVLAPTGIAAENIGGETIHSFFRIPPSDIATRSSVPHFLAKVKQRGKAFKEKVQNVALFVIDEISMVPDLLFDVIDQLLKLVLAKPLSAFGGKQIVATGDFFQLAPAASSSSQNNQNFGFAFESRVWKTIFPWDSCLELTQTFRQTDSTFVDLLNRARLGNLNSRDHSILFERTRQPQTNNEQKRFRIRLYSRKEPVQIHNARLKQKLERESCASPDLQLVFPFRLECKAWSASQVQTRKQQSEWKAKCYKHRGARATKSVQVTRIEKQEGKLRNSLADTQRKIIAQLQERLDIRDHKQTLLVGSRVMLTLNLNPERNLIHGSCGWIVGFHLPEEPCKRNPMGIKVVFDKHPDHWVLISPQTIRESCADGVVTVRYVPLKPAWAVTIHKSQGMTLDECSLSLKNIFTPGQAYVALSRVRTLEGLHLLDWDPKSIFANAKVKAFYESWKGAVSIKNGTKPDIQEPEQNRLPQCFDEFLFDDTVVTATATTTKMKEKEKEKEEMKVRTEKRKLEAREIESVKRPKIEEQKETGKEEEKDQRKDKQEGISISVLDQQLLSMFGPQWIAFWKQKSQALPELVLPQPASDSFSSVLHENS